ncbi:MULTISPECIES: hypothetical protein [Shewanella]|uniref:hypothetical protein n=1 Tax=Shewanella TaxID=22 RepID=UPI001BBCDF1E|nr:MULTISPECIES: hypothetical protein [Shewanella]GIU51674.1 hypothetical protein TUM4249_17630 [Shewanella sp. KT0246]
MLIKPIYEILPLTYMIVGAGSVALLKEPYAILASLLVFFYGAHIWNQRSKNRRTDRKRKRIDGILPESIYGYLPFIYIMSAGLIFRFLPKDSGVVISICLFTYGAYVLLRRISYRHHKIPTVQTKAKFN